MRAIAHIIDRGVNAALAGLKPSTYPALAREVTSSITASALYPLGVLDDALGAVVDRVAGPAAPTENALPVVLVHGYGSIKSHWLTLQVALRRRGFTDVSAINYNAWKDDIPEIAEQLVAHVDEVLADTGADKVHIVGHSMGGLVTRYAVELLGLHDRVSDVVTIASPHGGSAFAYAANAMPGRFKVTRSVAQMRPGSRLLRQLDAAARTRDGSNPVRWTALYSTGDLIVAGRSAKLRTPGARNIRIPTEGHVGMLTSPAVVGTVCDVLGTERPAPVAVAA